MALQHPWSSLTRAAIFGLAGGLLTSATGWCASQENFETTTLGTLPSSPYWTYAGPTTAGSVVDDGTGNRALEVTNQEIQRYSVHVGSRAFLAMSIDVLSTAAGSWMGQSFEGNDAWASLTSYEYLRPPLTGAGLRFPAVSSGRALIDNLSIQVVSPESLAIGRTQQFQDKLPSVAAYDFTAPQGRHNAIQNSISRLKAGENLEVLMLGDSIVGDSLSSIFFAQASKHYPGSITANLQIRGSTGVQHYQDPAQLQSYVLDHQFDILFVGGISNLNNGTPTLDAAEAALRSVLDQVLAERPLIDVILSAEMAGALSAGYGPNTSYAEAYDLVTDADWRARLYEVAGDYSNIAVIDTWKWYDAIGQSGLQYGDFMRDAVHMNGNGQLLAGEMLGEWLSPNNFAIVPEPSGFAIGAAAVAVALLLGRRATMASC